MKRDKISSPIKIGNSSNNVLSKKVTLSAIEYLHFTLIAKQYREHYDVVVHKTEVEVTASYSFLNKIGY